MFDTSASETGAHACQEIIIAANAKNITQCTLKRLIRQLTHAVPHNETPILPAPRLLVLLASPELLAGIGES